MEKVHLSFFSFEPIIKPKNCAFVSLARTVLYSHPYMQRQEEGKEELDWECVLNEPTSHIFHIILSKKGKILQNPK